MPTMYEPRIGAFVGFNTGWKGVCYPQIGKIWQRPFSINFTDICFDVGPNPKGGLNLQLRTKLRRAIAVWGSYLGWCRPPRPEAFGRLLSDAPSIGAWGWGEVDSYCYPDCGLLLNIIKTTGYGQPDAGQWTIEIPIISLITLINDMKY